MNDETYDPEAAYRENLKAAEKAHADAGLDESGLAPGQTHVSQRVGSVNAELAAQADAMQAQRDAEGRRLYEIDDAHRERTEALRRQAFGEAAAPAQSQPSPSQAGVAYPGHDEPAQPQNPVDAVIQRFENGETISQSELPAAVWREACANYPISLPDGYGLTIEHAAQLRACREAGLSDAQVQSVVRKMLQDN